MGSFLFALPAPEKVSITMGTSPADSFVVGQLVLATCISTMLTLCRSIAHGVPSDVHSAGPNANLSSSVLITHPMEGPYELQNLLRASWPQKDTCCALDAPADCSGLRSPLISARISLRSHAMSLMFQSCLSSSIGLVERAQLGSMHPSYLCMWQNPFSTPCRLEVC